MKAGRKGEGGRSKKLEGNMMHGSKLGTGGKGQHVRRVNAVEEDRMLGDVGDRGKRDIGCSDHPGLKREMSMSESREKDEEKRATGLQ